MIAFTSLFVAVFAICPAFGSPVSHYSELHVRSTPFPSKDPFYAAPDNISSYVPGAIVRSRRPPSPVGLFNFKSNLKESWQVLYRTTGALGEPLATVTTILVPYNADFRKLLSYQVEIDAPFSGCYPSITLQQTNAKLSNIASQYSELWFISALSRGWVVNVPDHEGPDAAFASGLVGGHATLDGIRAALSSNSITGIDPKAKIAVWGYSGGSLATEWALELQQEYAPELQITVAAMGGLPANIRNGFLKINKGIGAGLSVAGTIGLSKAYPEMADMLQKHVIPSKSRAFYKAETQCLVPTLLQYAFQDVFSYFDNGQGFINDPTVSGILQSEAMGNRNVSNVPSYYYHAVGDEILPFQDVEALYTKYCAAGANIHLAKQALGGHVSTALTGAAGALQYLINVMDDGKPAPIGCSSKLEVLSVLDAKNWSVLGDFVVDNILAILGNPIGPLRQLVRVGMPGFGA